MYRMYYINLRIFCSGVIFHIFINHNKVAVKSALSPVPLLGEIKYMVCDACPIKSAFP